MLTLYDADGSTLAPRPGPAPVKDGTIWVDLLEPTDDEDRFAEKELGFEIPTRAEMREIEASSRFYQENGAAYMTVFIIANASQEAPRTTALTFILARNRLVTVRYA
jgi:magnesium transporter